MCILQKTLDYVEKEITKSQQEISTSTATDRIVLIQYRNGLKAMHEMLENTSLHTKSDLLGALKFYIHANRNAATTAYIKHMAFTDSVEEVCKFIQGCVE